MQNKNTFMNVLYFKVLEIIFIFYLYQIPLHMDYYVWKFVFYCNWLAKSREFDS